MQCGFLPLKIVFPTLAAMLLGTNVQVPSPLLLSSFIDSLNTYEQGVLRAGLESKNAFAPEIYAKLISIISRFEGRQLPTPSNFREIVVQLARYQFLVKPMPATLAIYTGLPDFERPFWEGKSLADIYLLYISMLATPEKVIALVQEPESMNSGEQRVFTYLLQMIGNMRQHELSAFTRFVSGSSVCLEKKISVAFNNLSGLGRCPIEHTCDCLLELPLSYLSYLDFVTEFQSILSDTEYTWCMNAV